ncbi:unnamed protein product [Cunninghamella echinulata]
MDNVLLWDENKVNKWIASIGYPSLETQFKEQGITGDVLVNLDHDTLKDLSIHAVGQRMDILKHIYHLKTSHCIPVNEWDYIPPSVLYENDYLGPNGMADYRKIEAAFQERDIHLKKLTEDLVRLSTDMNRMREDMMHLWKSTKDKKPLPSFENDKSPPFKNYGSHKPLHSLTPPTTSSHSTDYFYGSYDNNNRRPIGSETTLYTDEAKLVPSVTINDGGAIKVYGEKISNNSKVELEASKNVRLLSDDTCSKVITAALKKYNVVDDWRQYSLWIQYGPHDNIQERLLSYDEKPLRISQKLKEAKLNPVYILKHVKDNKPFIPELHKTTDTNNMYNNNSNSNSNNTNTNNNNNNNNSRSIPKASYDNATTTNNNNNNNNNHSNYWKHSNEKSDQLPKTAIISGRVGYDVVAPVMSSSVSSPTPSTIQQRSNKNNNNNDHKTNQDTINNTNSNSNSNSNNNNNNSNIKINDSDKILEKDESKDNANATNSTILSQKPTDQFLTDLGLESANAIMYSLMMEQDSDKPL